MKESQQRENIEKKIKPRISMMKHIPYAPIMSENFVLGFLAAKINR